MILNQVYIDKFNLRDKLHCKILTFLESFKLFFLTLNSIHFLIINLNLIIYFIPKALNLKGIEYDYKVIDIMKGDQV